jgi:three-Cys-motif partner protein
MTHQAKEDFGDWAKKHVGKLRDSVEKVKHVQPNVTYGPKGEWTVAKLLVLGYWVDVYTKIIARQIRQKHFDSMYYIDLLAGSGICTIQRESRSELDLVAGSSIVAATYCYRPFTNYVLVEQKQQNLFALKERMNLLAANVTGIGRDCNDCIGEIVEMLTPRSHFLAFIDNEGADAKWPAVQSLVQRNGDIWITFQTSEIRRTVESSAVRSFLGLDEGDESPNDVLSYYVSKIENCGRIVKAMRVPGVGGFSYDLLFVTRVTRGRSPWLQIVDRLKERVEKLDIDFIRTILDQLSGRQHDLRRFLSSTQSY